MSDLFCIIALSNLQLVLFLLSVFSYQQLDASTIFCHVVISQQHLLETNGIHGSCNLPTQGVNEHTASASTRMLRAWHRPGITITRLDDGCAVRSWLLWTCLRSYELSISSDSKKKKKKKRKAHKNSSAAPPSITKSQHLRFDLNLRTMRWPWLSKGCCARRHRGNSVETHALTPSFLIDFFFVFFDCSTGMLET